MRGGILVESKGRLSNIDLCKDLNSIVNSKAIVSYRTALVDTDGNRKFLLLIYMPQNSPSLSPLERFYYPFDITVTTATRLANACAGFVLKDDRDKRCQF